MDTHITRFAYLSFYAALATILVVLVTLFWILDTSGFPKSVSIFTMTALIVVVIRSSFGLLSDLKYPGQEKHEALAKLSQRFIFWFNLALVGIALALIPMLAASYADSSDQFEDGALLISLVVSAATLSGALMRASMARISNFEPKDASEKLEEVLQNIQKRA